LSPIDQSSVALRYLMLGALFVFATAPMLFIVEASRRIAPCNPQPYAANNFLGYCWDRRYADYEKGAYYLPMEPSALAAAKQAEIVFLGNSRMEYAFSNPVIERFSEQGGHRIYTLGFAGEGYQFAQRLIERHDLRPRVLIVNLDGADFFYQPAMPDALKLISRPLPEWAEYSMKKAGQLIQRNVCKTPSWISSRLCGADDTLYRSIETGFWQFSHRSNYVDRFSTAVQTDMPDFWIMHRDEILLKARRFAEKMQARGSCVIFTTVPTERWWPEVVKDQAAAASVPLITSSLGDLRTFDHSHLGPASSERFSSEFLEKLQPYIDRCLARPAV